MTLAHGYLAWDLFWSYCLSQGCCRFFLKLIVSQVTGVGSLVGDGTRSPKPERADGGGRRYDRSAGEVLGKCLF